MYISEVLDIINKKMKKTIIAGSIIASVLGGAFLIPSVTYARQGADDAATHVRQENRRQDRATELRHGKDDTTLARRGRGGRANEGEAARGCDSARDLAERVCPVV
jgi:hypothetical protein